MFAAADQCLPCTCLPATGVRLIVALSSALTVLYTPVLKKRVGTPGVAQACCCDWVCRPCALTLCVVPCTE